MCVQDRHTVIEHKVNKQINTHNVTDTKSHRLSWIKNIKWTILVIWYFYSDQFEMYAEYVKNQCPYNEKFQILNEKNILIIKSEFALLRVETNWEKKKSSWSHKFIEKCLVNGGKEKLSRYLHINRFEPLQCFYQKIHLRCNGNAIEVKRLYWLIRLLCRT